MQLNDLKSTDYYYAEYVDSEKFVIVKGTVGRRPNILYNNSYPKFWMKNRPSAVKNIRLATLEEKHWLNTCIILNKYVSFEDAMKYYNIQPIEKHKADPELDKILIKLLNL